MREEACVPVLQLLYWNPSKPLVKDCIQGGKCQSRIVIKLTFLVNSFSLE